MKKLEYLLLAHGIIIPSIILLLGDLYVKEYIFITITIALLWIIIFGGATTRKINKLKQEMDASK